jgi:hypothetical protein
VATEERQPLRGAAVGIVGHALTAAVLWCGVTISWFNWLTPIFAILALFSTGLLGLMLWALSRERARED